MPTKKRQIDRSRPKRKAVGANASDDSLQLLSIGLGDLWVDVEDNIPRPILTRIQVLPLDALSWENFEKLCFRLAHRTGSQPLERILTLFLFSPIDHRTEWERFPLTLTLSPKGERENACRTLRKRTGSGQPDGFGIKAKLEEKSRKAETKIEDEEDEDDSLQ